MRSTNAYNNKVAPTIRKGVHFVHSEEELKTAPEQSLNDEKIPTDNNGSRNRAWFKTLAPTISHYATLIILGLLTWGLLYFGFGEGWWWDRPWFRLALVAVAAWAAGVALESATTLPPLLAALFTGIAARNLGYLDMRQFTEVDVFLRKIYPVIILGKGSLGWDIDYMKTNWKPIAALGVVPWSAEVVSVAFCMHFLLGHPWIWGFLLGTFYCSVSGPVIMPNVLRAGVSPRRSHNWPQYIGLSGGTETALSVGIYGVLASFLFSDDNDTYRYMRAFSTMGIGLALGIAWGSLAGCIPHSADNFAPVLRTLFVLLGGLFASFATSHFGWGGVAGVAVLACNATAFTYWKDEWVQNNNPVATAYRVMWSACEPAVFAYTGSYLVINSSLTNIMLWSLAILAVCTAVRLCTVSLMCWHLAFREKMFVCCCWSTKSIVEAVICPMALNTVLLGGSNREHLRYAEEILVVTVVEIIITTPLAFTLTKLLGPSLLKDKVSDYDNEIRS